MQGQLPSTGALNWVCAKDEPPFHLRVTTSSSILSWAKHTRSQGSKWQHYASEHELCKIMHANTQGRRTSNFFSQLWRILVLQHVLANSLKSSKNIFLALYIPIFSLPSSSRKFLIAKIAKIASNENMLQNIGWISACWFQFHNPVASFAFVVSLLLYEGGKSQVPSVQLRHNTVSVFL